MSAWYISLNREELVVDTIKHEIAHALAWVRFGKADHGPTWVRMCGEVGCRPRRLKNDVIAPPKKFIAHCGDCGKIFTRDRPMQRGKVAWCRCQDVAGKDALDRHYLTYTMNPLFVESVSKRSQVRLAAENAEVVPEAISELLTQLSMTKDRNVAKTIRAKLRRLGHRGGLH